MTGIWSYNTSRQTPSLDGCRRKVERAKHHIDNITADARSFLTSCGYRLRRDHQGDPPWLILTVEEVNLPQVPEQFSIVAGEAIYQLRTTLDHLVFELIRLQNHEPTRKNSWPILTQKNIPVFERKTKGVSPSALQLIESLQPYQMGDRYEEHTLWRLRELNDWDKHRFVIRTFLAAYHGIEIEWTDDAGRSQKFSESGSEEIKRGDEFRVGPGRGIRPETEIDIKTSSFIVFEDIAGFNSKPIGTTLDELADEVARIVESFSEFSCSAPGFLDRLKGTVNLRPHRRVP